jgi:hypothetical protein
MRGLVSKRSSHLIVTCSNNVNGNTVQTRNFVALLSTEVLSRREPASTATSGDSCGIQISDKRYAL